MEKKLTAEGRKDVVVILIVKTVKNKKSCRKYGLLHFEPILSLLSKLGQRLKIPGNKTGRV
jgi:hypothetical protein